MRLNTKTHQPVTIEEQPPEDVVEFVYLGSNISTGEADKDVELCISKARRAFRTLRPVWPFPSSPETQHQYRIFNTNVKSVLLYCRETWKTTKSIINKLQVFIDICLKYILRITWPNKISNVDLWRL